MRNISAQRWAPYRFSIPGGRTCLSIPAFAGRQAHVHMIVPAGGVDKSGEWIHSRKNGKYLFPVKAMSKVYRGKFMERFRQFMAEKGMEITPDLHRKFYAKDWVVFAKKPFGGAGQVIEYLGRYTHKVAISNHRLKRIDNGKITFSYKDYRQGGKKKIMTLDAMEFLRRFCMHILPRGFRKIRHYGLLASRNKGKLRELQQEMGAAPEEETTSFYKQMNGSSLGAKQCPACKKGRMEEIFSFRPHAPPRLNQSRNDRKLLRNKTGN